MNIGPRILALLGKKGMSQMALAQKINVTELSMSRYISGERLPRANTIVRMADELNTTTDYILGRTEKWHMR